MNGYGAIPFSLSFHPSRHTAVLASTMMLAVLLGAMASTTFAVTVNRLTVTITADGHTATSMFRVTDIDDDGMVTLNVADQLVADIQAAFGTSTFAFPAVTPYAATFTFDGRTLTVSLQSSDMFVLQFV